MEENKRNKIGVRVTGDIYSYYMIHNGKYNYIKVRYINYNRYGIKLWKLIS
jgi:hypothetical protein